MENISSPPVQKEKLIDELAILSKLDFNFMHLNINSIKNKGMDVHDILNNANFDIICLSETRLDSSFPSKQFNNKNYKLLRYNRPINDPKNKPGGGIFIYVKNNINIINYKISDTDFEFIYILFQTNKKSLPINFVCCYKPPDYHEEKFLENMDNFLFTLNLDLPLFIVGDLNMDLLNDANKNLKDFIIGNGLVNFVKETTRTFTKFYQNKNEQKTSNTLIDVVLHNGTLIKDCKVFDCFFSDHNLITTKLSIPSKKKNRAFIIGRKLGHNNMNLIINDIKFLNFRKMTTDNIEHTWDQFKTSILLVLEKYAPEAKIFLKDYDFPWYDDELLRIRNNRDSSYKELVKNKQPEATGVLKNQVNYWKNVYESVYEQKLIEYFEKKGINDFKNSRLFWEFYSSFIKIKSDKSNTSSIPTTMTKNELTFNGYEQICEGFNLFFTNILSDSTDNIESCEKQCKSHFDELIAGGIFEPKTFAFSFTNRVEVEKLISELSDNSGPGFTAIPTKIIKETSKLISPFLSDLFNNCLLKSKIPNDWKKAIVTPLFKNKGQKTEMNNYRSISVLSPVAKIFEKIIYRQIFNYFNTNMILIDNQHGFRPGRSCETALHSILSQMFKILSERQIGLFLFVDFKKAFDTVDSKL